jgi:hypothetical protein
MLILRQPGKGQIECVRPNACFLIICSGPKSRFGPARSRAIDSSPPSSAEWNREIRGRRFFWRSRLEIKREAMEKNHGRKGRDDIVTVPCTMNAQKDLLGGVFRLFSGK